MLNAMNDSGKHLRDSLSMRRARRLPVSTSTGRGAAAATIVPLLPAATGASLSAAALPPDRSCINTSTHAFYRYV